ncbi:hypothetical protein CPB85DRAFT_1436425 [Mucidula mucida]|nr:hypothetical protein CPB85DRAFT_1436425 [Mucidula mucida]
MSSQPSVPTNVLISDPGVKHTHIKESVKPTSLVARSLAAPHDLYDYRVYNTTSTMCTFAGRVTFYSRPGDEAMYAVVNRFLKRVQWVQLIAWKNDTDATQQYQYSYTTGLTITQGSEITNGFNLGASYKGMSIGVNHSRHTFKTTKITSSATTTITVSVPPRSELMFYQKRFDFCNNITFINNAWGQDLVKIMAEEYFTKSARLPEGPGSVAVDSVLAALLAGWTRKRENITQRAKDTLTRMGL